MSHMLTPSYAICFCLILLPTQRAQADGNPLTGIDAFVIAARNHWEVPGLSIAVVKDGKVVFKKGYGLRVVGADAPVNAATLFNIASCTKSFTATAVAVLVDQGKVGWDDAVLKYVPDIRFSNNYMTRHVTLRDLLCHRTGLERGELLLTRGDMNHVEALRRIRYLKSESPFRTKNTYSNLMYALLGDVVARSSELPLPQFVKKMLFEPLEMNATTFSIGELQRRNFAPRHWRDDGKIRNRGVPDVYDAAAAGGVYSSADDMAKWLQLQLALGRCGDRQLISKKSMREMHAIHNSIPVRNTSKDNPYAARFYGAGLGWFMLDYRGRKLVMHTGAWGAVVALVPEENLGVVVLSNLDWNGMTGLLMYRVLDAYCAPSKTVWSPDNFEQFDSEGPGHAYRSRDRERAKLIASRSKVAKAALPLAKHAGHYRSSLFGDLQVAYKDKKLSLRIGRYTTELNHWESNVFYAKSPTQLNFDWLVRFEVKDGGVNKVTLQYVGWHEPDAEFQRVREWSKNE